MRGPRVPEDEAPEYPSWSAYSFATESRKAIGRGDPEFAVAWRGAARHEPPERESFDGVDRNQKFVHALRCLAQLAHQPGLADDLLVARSFTLRFEDGERGMMRERANALARIEAIQTRLFRALRERAVLPPTSNARALPLAIEVYDRRSNAQRPLPDLTQRVR